MMSIVRRVLFLLSLFSCLFIFTSISVAQELNSDKVEKRIIQILQANIGTRSEIDGKAKRRLIGQVRIIDGDTKIFCDSAIHFITDGRLEAYGNIQIIERKRQIFSDYMTYELASDLSIFSGRVLMVEDSTVVLTTEMEYFSDAEEAVFRKDFQLLDNGSKLFANRGRYFRVQDSAIVSGNVQSENIDGVLTTDSLIISKKNGRSYGIGSVFFKDSNGLNSLQSDTLFADSLGYRLAKGNVFTLKVDSTEADTMVVWAKEIEIVPIEEGKSTRILNAIGNVKQWSNTISAISDTLLYNEKLDSLSWLSNPIIWQNESELSAKTIHLKMQNGKAKMLYANALAKHIGLDSLTNRFNQLSADQIVVQFDTTKNSIMRLNAIGSAQTIYQSVDETNAADGLIKLAAKEIQISFDEQGNAQDVTSISEIKGNYFEEEPSLKDLKIANFSWNPTLKPLKPVILPKVGDNHTWVDESYRLFTYPYDWNLPEELSYIWFPE